MYDRSYNNSRYTRKRGSHDSSVKEQRSYNSFKATKKGNGMAEISIDLQSKNNRLSLNNPNFSYRQKSNDCHLSELREEVEQLRMENQSLRQELKLLKNNETNLSYQVQKLKEGFNHEKCVLKKEIGSLEERVFKYSEKIKELFENLIKEKKKSAGIEDVRINMAVSPSAKSSNYLQGLDVFQKYEEQGEKDFYSSISRQNRSKFSNYHSHRRQGFNAQNQEYLNLFNSRGKHQETFGIQLI